MHFFRYFDHNLKLPIYNRKRCTYSAEDVIRILFEVEKSKICTAQPYGCTKSYTFVIDHTTLDDKDDLKCDDLGVWHHNGVSTLYFDVKFEGPNVKEITRLGSKRPAVLHPSIYALKRCYWRHKSNIKFNRKIFEIIGMSLKYIQLYSSCLF